MNKFQLVSLLLASLSTVPLTACSEDNTPQPGNKQGSISEKEMNAVIETYVDRVVLPTYAQMEERVTELHEACFCFK